jgi:hypothetical protein
MLQLGCKYVQRSQKLCQIVMKTVNFFTNVYMVSFKCHVTPKNLSLTTSLDVEEYKLNY